ncbi:hypothetical protein ACFPOA_05745 [Lysobacter niabensis]|uniref:hypothetical protein n=1 Tax=Agrilutibacter niabensis TaxID=380628 RepID=UPI003615CBF2
MTNAAQLKEIAQELRRLQQSSPVSRDGLDAWYADGRRFVEWQHSKFPDVRLPPQVMFYLHDADLRVKDSEYRMAQDEALGEIIVSLENGSVPESSGGLSLSFHPRWLGAVALVVVAIIYWVTR